MIMGFFNSSCIFWSGLALVNFHGPEICALFIIQLSNLINYPS